MTIQQWFYLALSLIGLFLSSWIIVPAPIFSLLPLAVGAPEISPLLLLGNAIMLGVSLLQRSRSWGCYLAIASSVVGLILSSLPLFHLPSTVQRAEQMMQTALGNQYLTQIPGERKARMRPHPFALADLITGIAIPTVHVERQSFLTLDGTRLPLDIYHPTTPQPHPAIVTIYGGAWQRGNPEQHATFNRYIASQGYTVVAIDYRHAPRYQFPTQIEDVQAALHWLTQNAAAWQIDTTRVALMGWSAGAHLALLTAYQAGIIPIRAVVSYYSPTNLTAGYHDPPVPDPINSRAVLEAFLGGTPAELPQQYKQASPIQHVKPGLPPTLLIYGDRDHVVKPVFSQQLYHQLQLTGNTAVWISLPWAEHAFDAVFRGLGNQIALYYTERFLAWALR
ncbi:alpha/beta hydrolase fold domain-containing protein [Pantanalinema sp. GBBB05]|uniref:alpha/beta hydrolase fold domain-containing protein n=1 Tax=Pantanalinema sp. GBBB05 TaxID=2604139 RepID=UPI001D962383|nr:alpha/beta hydrolase [Pantanalinema sp. GBBB05]